jgi:uncharacterized membrane protein (UPF0136 family)
MSLDVFNVISGIVTIASLFFSGWVYWSTKSKKAVETQRINQYLVLLKSSQSLNYAAINQAKLLSSVSDREETTRKELKHLGISVLSTLISLHELISNGISQTKSWSFGIPSEYFHITHGEENRDIKNDEHLETVTKKDHIG